MALESGKEGDLVGLYAIWDGKVLIHRRKEDLKDADSLKLSTPGGGVDAGETFGAAAVREALEEAGLKVDVADLQLLSEEEKDGHQIKHFYVYFDEKPELSTDPSVVTHGHEVAEYDFAGVPGLAAGNRHWWAPIDQLLQYLDENPALKVGYVVDALAGLKGRLGQRGGGGDTISVLSYNISWETMAGKPGWCPGTNCAKNITDYITTEGKTKDFVGLQESSPINQVKILLPAAEFSSIAHKSGFEDMILFYKKTYKLEDQIVGQFKEGRPFIAAFFEGNICVINVHPEHNDENKADKPDAFVSLHNVISGSITDAAKKAAIEKKLKDYNIILMGDTNYPKITEKADPYEIKVMPGIKRSFYGLHKMPTCCLKGGYDASGNPNKDASGNPIVMKLDEAIDQILSTWSDTKTSVDKSMEKDASDHLPVTAVITTTGGGGGATPATPGPKGIGNDGNFCFFNSVLQLYNQITGLREAVRKTTQTKVEPLKSIFDQLNDATPGPINITSKYGSLFEGKKDIFLNADGSPKQSDALEFISQIMIPTLEAATDTKPLDNVTFTDKTVSYCTNKPADKSIKDYPTSLVLLNTDKPSLAELFAAETKAIDTDGKRCGTPNTEIKISHEYFPGPKATHLIVGLKRMNMPAGGAVGGAGTFNSTPITIDMAPTINDKTYELAGAVLYNGAGTAGHYLFALYNAGKLTNVINDGTVDSTLPTTYDINKNGIVFLYKLSGAGGGAGAGPVAGPVAGKATAGLRRKTGSTLNAEIRMEFAANTSPNPINTIIKNRLNIFGDIYDLQVHEEMRAAPGTLIQFMTDYGINTEYGIPLISLIKAFFDIFPDGSDDEGLPIAGFAERPAFHVICNYLKYRILTLRFEMQLKRLNSMFRYRLLKRSEALEKMLEEGKCGTVSAPSALDAFLKSMDAPKTGTGMGCCDELNKKLDTLIGLMSGPDAAALADIQKQLDDAESGKTTLTNDQLIDLLRKLGRFSSGSDDFVKRITKLLSGSGTSADMDELMKVVQPDLAKLVKKIVEDVTKNKAVSTEDLAALIKYYEELHNAIYNFKELFTIYDQIETLIDQTDRKTPLGLDKPLLLGIFADKQDLAIQKQKFQEMELALLRVVNLFKALKDKLGQADQKKLEEIVDKYIAKFITP